MWQLAPPCLLLMPPSSPGWGGRPHTVQIQSITDESRSSIRRKNQGAAQGASLSRQSSLMEDTQEDEVEPSRVPIDPPPHHLHHHRLTVTVARARLHKAGSLDTGSSRNKSLPPEYLNNSTVYFHFILFVFLLFTSGFFKVCTGIFLGEKKRLVPHCDRCCGEWSRTAVDSVFWEIALVPLKNFRKSKKASATQIANRRLNIFLTFLHRFKICFSKFVDFVHFFFIVSFFFEFFIICRNLNCLTLQVQSGHLLLLPPRSIQLVVTVWKKPSTEVTASWGLWNCIPVELQCCVLSSRAALWKPPQLHPGTPAC